MRSVNGRRLIQIIESLPPWLTETKLAIIVSALSASRERPLRGSQFGVPNYRSWPGGAAGGRWRRSLAPHDPNPTVMKVGFRGSQ
jgi:hypothetical protein